MIPVVIAFTPNYLVPAAVTLRSILDSSPDGQFEVWCLVTVDIPQRQKNLLSDLAQGRMTFRYVNLAGRLEGCYVDPRYSEAASYRLLLPELLPDLDRIIYTDCDIVIRRDLAGLDRTIELGDKLLAAVYEAPIEGQAERWEALGCDPGRYFNSGFLVMNLRQMREEGTSAKLMEALHADYLEFPDQDALNIVCRGRVLPLSPVFNSIRTFFLPQYKSDFLRQYSVEDWDSVQAGGSIHYTGGKPWNLFTVRFGDWWRIYDNLPEEIRAGWAPNVRMLRLWRFYRTAFGRFAVDRLQTAYRTIKH